MNTWAALVEKALARARASSEVVLALVMAMVVGSLIVPLPEWALDLGIAINLAAALALLVAALSAKSALKVASFPTLLLITTLFRLAMNVSSTRLALSEGHAGDIIQAFGDFVVRGDYVVGAVIFAILTLVQFMVVTKGAERVAEVAARFTLDAMPGKQMSIDADLRAGAITQDEARARRRALERESQMFGSMDGAMKFVKGDVIAGLVITLINLLGGTAIGVLQGGLTAAEALSTYALISIGDGLVSQIPSLCIAVAAGIVVTRVASEREDDGLGTDIGSQFFGQWRALLVVSGLSLALALMPGMPHLTFVVIALLAAGLGLGLRSLAARPVDAKPVPTRAAPAPPGPAATEVGPARLMLDLSEELTWLTDESQSSFVTVELQAVRDRLLAELGVRLPPFKVRTGARVGAAGWQLSVDEVPAGRASVEGRLFAMMPPGEIELLGLTGATAAADPATGKAISMVPESERARIEALGVQVRTLGQLIGDHLVGLLKKRASAFIGVHEVQQAVSLLESQSASLVREALGKVPLPLLTDVLKRLVNEQVSVRNLRQILEALVAPSTEGDAAALTERCRAALGRQISHQFANGGPLFAWLVDPAIEETLRQSGPAQAIDPGEVGAILNGMKRVARQGKAVLLASPDVRRTLRRLIEGSYPEVAVLTYAELDAELQVRPVGRLSPA